MRHPRKKKPDMTLTSEQVEAYLRDAAKAVREVDGQLDRYFCMPASARTLVLRGST